MIYAVACIVAGACIGGLIALGAGAVGVAMEVLVEVHYIAADHRRQRREAKRAAAAPPPAAEPDPALADNGTTQPEYDALFAQITDCPINEQYRDRRHDG